MSRTILILALLNATPAFAQPPPEPAPPPAPEAQPPEPATPPGITTPREPAPEVVDEKPKKKKKKEGLLPGLEFKGRVFARAAYEKLDYPTTGTEAIDLSVPSGRFGVKYEPIKWISMVLEADVADKPLLRDAFVQARSKHLRGRMGQFKMPLSSITLESPWNLPVARRGTIQKLLQDRMRVVGRRPGAIGAVRGGGWLDPELALSVFQGAGLDSKGDLDYVKDTALDSHNELARVSGTPSGADLALVGGRITTREAGVLKHFWVAGGDATVEHLFERSALRLWAEALAGEVQYTRSLPDLTLEQYTATYWEARAILAWRWGGLEQGDHYIEPFGYFGLLDPDSDASNDLFWEAFAGVNVGLWRNARITLQVEHARGDSGMPLDLFPLGAAIRKQTSVVLQVGAAF
jgi:hypothetical protein